MFFFFYFGKLCLNIKIQNIIMLTEYKYIIHFIYSSWYVNHFVLQNVYLVKQILSSILLKLDDFALLCRIYFQDFNTTLEIDNLWAREPKWIYICIHGLHGPKKDICSKKKKFDRQKVLFSHLLVHGKFLIHFHFMPLNIDYS